MYTIDNPKLRSELFLKKYFREQVLERKFSPERGRAHYSKAGKYDPNSNVFTDINDDATHVIWIKN